jgi:hypothetical protein
MGSFAAPPAYPSVTFEAFRDDKDVVRFFDVTVRRWENVTTDVRLCSDIRFRLHPANARRFACEVFDALGSPVPEAPHGPSPEEPNF